MIYQTSNFPYHDQPIFKSNKFAYFNKEEILYY